MTPAIVALTPAGIALARRAAEAVGGEVHALSLSRREKVAAKLVPRFNRGNEGLHADEITFADTAAHIRSLFAAGRPIVGICAAGILIRILAPLLTDKRDEPPVLAVSEDGVSIVPLIGGHRGANDLAHRLAAALGGHAAVTTAGDSHFGVALDAPPPGWTLANPGDAKPVMAALLGGAAARLEGNADWLAASRIPFSADGALVLRATTHATPGDSRTLVYHPRRLAIGVGCERGADPAEAIALVDRALAESGLAPASVALVASLDLKADEPAVLAVAAHLGVAARFFSAAVLEAETPRLENPSDAVFREVGCHGVAEGAALAAAGGAAELIVAKRKSARVTCAIAAAPDIIDATAGRARGRLAIVGIGPGAADWLTPEARRLLETSDAAIGYALYLDLVQPLIRRAERIDSQLGSEEARARQALALAAAGRSVVLVSSGDAGIYAMASLVFECLDRPEGMSPREPKGALTSPLRGGRNSPAEGAVNFGRGATALPSDGATALPSDGATALPDAAHRIEIVVAPGISAMQAAAARLGAPLGHDFCAISLSDLLTPWAAIEARIRAAAEADFVIAFYNPVSQRRTTQLAAAKRILLRHRPPATPVVLARNLGRDGESVRTVTIAELDPGMVDMLTLVLVGSSATRQVAAAGRDWLYTPRGYESKRNADAAE